MSDGEQILYSEEVYNRYTPLTAPVSFAGGLLIILAALFSFMSNSVNWTVFLYALPAGAAAFYVAFYYSRKYKRQLEIVSKADGSLLVRIMGQGSLLQVNPAGEMAFYFRDSLMEESKSFWKNSEGNSGFPLLGSAQLYAVFFNKKDEPVFSIYESVMTVITHLPKNGYVEIDDETGNADYLTGLPCFKASVQKIYSFCQVK